MCPGHFLQAGLARRLLHSTHRILAGPHYSISMLSIESVGAWVTGKEQRQQTLRPPPHPLGCTKKCPPCVSRASRFLPHIPIPPLHSWPKQAHFRLAGHRVYEGPQGSCRSDQFLSLILPLGLDVGTLTRHQTLPPGKCQAVELQGKQETAGKGAEERELKGNRY